MEFLKKFMSSSVCNLKLHLQLIKNLNNKLTVNITFLDSEPVRGNLQILFQEDR